MKSLLRACEDLRPHLKPLRVSIGREKQSGRKTSRVFFCNLDTRRRSQFREQILLTLRKH